MREGYQTSKAQIDALTADNAQLEMRNKELNQAEQQLNEQVESQGRELADAKDAFRTMAETINQDLKTLNSLIADEQSPTTLTFPDSTFSGNDSTPLDSNIKAFTRHTYKLLSTTFINQLEQKNQIESLTKESGQL